MNASPLASAPQNSAIDEANDVALDRILAVQPAWCGLELARDALQLKEGRLLHAGPPLTDPGQACRPLLNSAITATLFEGWAATADEAERLTRSGGVSLHAAQDHNCVVPLADVVSPSMWLQVVSDLRSASASAYSPLNGGPTRVMRVGVLGADVLEHLHWINGPFAKTLHGALKQPVPLIEIADTALIRGDDLHGNTASSTALLLPHLALKPNDPSDDRCRDFLNSAPGFFLNFWMAATKCMLNAAAGIQDATVVIAAGGNGTHFGIQVGRCPGLWFETSAEPPALALEHADLDPFRVGAIGDSAIVDLFGFGAMTTLSARPRPHAAFADVYPNAITVPRQLLTRSHPRFSQSAPLVVIDARRIPTTKEAPIVSLGVLDKAGQRGRLAGGFYRPPIELFATAVAPQRP